jgi:tetratricopeptide (TPR) repeat protein
MPKLMTTRRTPRADSWLDDLGRHLDAGDNPLLAQRAVQILMKNRRHAQALTILENLPEAKPMLAAECYEETAQFDKAAAVYLELGEQDKALRCYRSLPDFSAALCRVRKMEGHTARPALEWLAELDAVITWGPENFHRAMTAPEKKLLEGMLERGLGVQRKKPAVKKAAAKGSHSKAVPKRAPSRHKPDPGRR